MALVHDFSIDNTLYADTRVPFQYRGNSRPNGARAFELSALVAFIEANMATPGGSQTATITSGSDSAAVAAGRLVEKIVVIGSGAFKCGSSAGADDLVDSGTAAADGRVYVFEKYFHTAGSLYFSGFSGTLTVKIFSRK